MLGTPIDVTKEKGQSSETAARFKTNRKNATPCNRQSSQHQQIRSKPFHSVTHIMNGGNSER